MAHKAENGRKRATTDLKEVFAKLCELDPDRYTGIFTKAERPEKERMILTPPCIITDTPEGTLVIEDWWVSHGGWNWAYRGIQAKTRGYGHTRFSKQYKRRKDGTFNVVGLHKAIVEYCEERENAQKAAEERGKARGQTERKAKKLLEEAGLEVPLAGLTIECDDRGRVLVKIRWQGRIGVDEHFVKLVKAWKTVLAVLWEEAEA